MVGGSKTDLAAFDHESVARAVAMCPIPVFTGIGHEIDRSAADGAAHTACPTPTAAAETVAGITTDWLHRLDHKAITVASRSRLVLANADRWLHQSAELLTAACRSNLRDAERQVSSTSAHLTAACHSILRDAERQVSSTSARVHALDPATLLRRGWSITRRASDGSVVRSAGDVAEDDVILTQTADAVITSTVITRTP